jgi:hypothetical protein
MFQDLHPQRQITPLPRVIKAICQLLAPYGCVLGPHHWTWQACGLSRILFTKTEPDEHFQCGTIL